MIEVTYRPAYNAITVDGHALSGEAGHDLVCAAASTLLYTYGDNVNALALEGAVRDVQMDLDSGHGRISCKATTRYRAQVRLVLNAITLGFASLAENYPDNVKFSILGQ